MKTIATCALLWFLMFCFTGCDRSKDDVLTYTRQLRPGMTIEQVKSVFPKEMHWKDEAADESKEYCWMMRCYSTNQVTHRLCFKETEFGRVATVYFGSNDRLIGFDLYGSGDPQLELGSNELRFPGELRFPSEFAGGHAAYPELYRRAIHGSITNQP
jgi:hypothetical protein